MQKVKDLSVGFIIPNGHTLSTGQIESQIKSQVNSAMVAMVQNIRETPGAYKVHTDYVSDRDAYHIKVTIKVVIEDGN